MEPARTVTVEIPFTIRKRGGRKQIITPDGASVLICTLRHLLALHQDCCRPQRRLNSYWLLTMPRLLHWPNSFVRRVGILIVITYLAKKTLTAETFCLVEPSL